MWIRLLCLCLLDSPKFPHDFFIDKRLRVNSSLTFLQVLKDRIHLIYLVFRALWFKPYPLPLGSYYLNTVYSEEKDKQASFVSQASVSRLSYLDGEYKLVNLFYFFKIKILFIAISALSIFDLKKKKYYVFYEALYLLLQSSELKRSDIYIFSSYYAPFYFFANFVNNKANLTVCFGTAPISYYYHCGSYVLCSVLLNSNSQIDEYKILFSRNQFRAKDVRIGPSFNGAKLGGVIFHKATKTDVGFFSEGWWLRSQETGFIKGDLASIKHSFDKGSVESHLEAIMLDILFEGLEGRGIDLTYFEHPCERIASTSGLTNPVFEKYPAIKSGTHCNGISKYWSVKVGFVMSPGSSIVAQRRDINLKTICLCPTFVRSFRGIDVVNVVPNHSGLLLVKSWDHLRSVVQTEVLK
jgi:hypothetical protein